jgi:protein TIF31
MSEAPKINFNVNVFRNGVTFDMPEDEIRQDEALVEDLSRFMMEDCIKNLVQSMKGLDGTPNDSEGLTNCFHKHGVNMRYIGKVLKAVN